MSFEHGNSIEVAVDDMRLYLKGSRYDATSCTIAG